MKYLPIIFLLIPSAFANSDLEQRIKNLEAKVAKLEKMLGNSSTSSASSGGLKVKDYNNSEVKRSISSTSSSNMPTMTEEQQKEIMKQLELMKERQGESQKMLDQIMNDEF